MDPIESFTREYRGITIKVNWYRDDYMNPPWQEHDGHGPVSDWKSRDEKLPDERPMHQDGGSYRFYDWQEAMKIAKRDGWGLGEEALEELRKKLDHEPTKGEITAESVQRDFDYLRRWCQDDWYWCFREVELEGMAYVQKFVSGDGKGGWKTITHTGSDTLGGIDSDSIKEFTDEAFEAAIAYIDKELAEREWAEGREIITEAA